MRLEIDLKLLCFFDRHFHPIWLQSASHIAPKMIQNGAVRCGTVPYLMSPQPTSLHIAAQTPLGPHFLQILILFRPIFDSILCSFWCSASPNTLRKLLTQIYANAQIKIKMYKNICSHVRLDRSSLFDPRLNVRPSHKTPRPKMRGRR